MANYSESTDDQMNRVFAALADPTRRSVLAQLETAGPLSVTELAEPLTIKMPTVLKHLGVLDDAGLIRREKKGRVVTVTLTPEPMAGALEWLQRYERFWAERLDRLGKFLEEDN